MVLGESETRTMRTDLLIANALKVGVHNRLRNNKIFLEFALQADPKVSARSQEWSEVLLDTLKVELQSILRACKFKWRPPAPTSRAAQTTVFEPVTYAYGTHDDDHGLAIDGLDSFAFGVAGSEVDTPPLTPKEWTAADGDIFVRSGVADSSVVCCTPPTSPREWTAADG